MRYVIDIFGQSALERAHLCSYDGGDSMGGSAGASNEGGGQGDTGTTGGSGGYGGSDPGTASIDSNSTGTNSYGMSFSGTTTDYIEAGAAVLGAAISASQGSVLGTAATLGAGAQAIGNVSHDIGMIGGAVIDAYGQQQMSDNPFGGYGTTTSGYSSFGGNADIGGGGVVWADYSQGN